MTWVTPRDLHSRHGVGVAATNFTPNSVGSIPMGRHWTTSITLRLPLEKARTAPPWCSSLASAIIYCLAGWTSQSQHMHQQNLLPCPIITWHQMWLFFCSSQIQHTITHLDVCYQVCRAFLQSVLQAPFQLCNSVIISPMPELLAHIGFNFQRYLWIMGVLVMGRSLTPVTRASG